LKQRRHQGDGAEQLPTTALQRLVDLSAEQQSAELIDLEPIGRFQLSNSMLGGGSTTPRDYPE
jgi:hypothetical protein